MDFILDFDHRRRNALYASIELNHHQSQALIDIVVKFPCKPGPLLFVGLDQ